MTTTTRDSIPGSIPAARDRTASHLSMFHDDDFFLDISKVSLGPVVGRGQFSEVHVGHYFGDLVAIKVQRRENVQLEEYLLRELSVLKNTGHESLLTYLGAFNEINSDGTTHKLYIVTEYCHGGDLLTLLMDLKQPLSWKFRLKIASQAISALAYLHEKKLLHRDVKSSNILLDEFWNCKVSDFGMSREYSDDGAGARMTICGTDAYMAPEMLFEEEYTNSVDVFSFGMVLLEIMKRQKVAEGGFAVRDPRKLFRLDEDEIRAALPEDAPPSFVALAINCIKYEPPERPTSNDALEWLQDLLGSTEGEIEYPSKKSSPQWGAAATTTTSGSGGAGHSTAADVGTATTPTARANAGGNHRPSILSTSIFRVHQQLQPFAPRKSSGADEDLEGDEVRKTGLLFKRATNGFRNWKQVVFILTRSALRWKSNSTGMTKGRVLLRGVTLQRTIMYRFKMIPPAGAAAEGDEAGYASILNGELSAGSKAELDEWLDEIQQVIDEIAETDRHQRERHASAAAFITAFNTLQPSLPQQQHSRGSTGLGGAIGPGIGAGAGAGAGALQASDGGGEGVGGVGLGQTMLSAFGNVADWLRALQLEDRYLQAFISKGYDVPALLEAGGLDNDDLDCLGIYTPLHRRLLKSSAGLPYSDALVLELPRWRDFNGVICYDVVSCYKFSRSSTFKRFRDFQAFDAVLRHELREEGPARLTTLPSLPSATALPSSLAGSKDVAFIAARRAALEEYLEGVAAALRGSGRHHLLLRFLDLTISATEMDDAYS